MRLLLDTHTFVWALTSPERLGRDARRLLSDPANIPIVSAVSAYEVAHNRLRRRTIPAAVATDFVHSARQLGAELLSVTAGHALLAGRFAQRHGDPWDRILAAQSIIEDMPLLSADRQLADLGATVIW